MCSLHSINSIATRVSTPSGGYHITPKIQWPHGGVHKIGLLFIVHINKYLFPCNKSLLTEMYIDVSFDNKVQRQFKTVQQTLTGNVTCHCFGFWLLPVLFCILMCLPVFVSFL